ncbi:MAG: alpha/beta fold hydrolase [Planctomycetes bacterium]|nr:alpha/beta fold hydrolase [Planctomycetota bacterium]
MIDPAPWFRPPRWASGPHGQTLAGHLLRRSGGLAVRRERFELPDGDFVDLDWFAAMPMPAGVAGTSAESDGRCGAPLVLLLHGLEGSARSGYIRSVARAVLAAGGAAVALNFRGCSGEPNRLPRAYHAGEIGDLDQVVAELRRRESARVAANRAGDALPRLSVVGFSLGGNVLLRWLGEHCAAAREQIAAAAAVSVPFDLAAGADWTAVGPGRLYAVRLLRELRRKVGRKAGQLAAAAARDERAARVDLARALRARTFREFDEAYTAPVHGFRDADDYYARSSSAGVLARIAVPTLVVHALDDPFLPAPAVPFAALAANPSLQAWVAPTGGHVGFVTGRPWAPRFAADQAVAEYVVPRGR